jgi:serine/threonine protein kinase
LDEACAGEPVLRAEVERMLADDGEPTGFLDPRPTRLPGVLLDRQPAALSPGDRVGCYQIERQLSVGGMGEVYLTQDAATGQRAVVKLIRPHLTADPRAVERFATEARAASSLDHPNIVGVYESGESKAGMFIAMEWVDGPTLRAVMDGGPAPLDRALEWCRQAARGLAAAHEAGIVHRDLKPENIMLTSTGVVKILDFGLARLPGSILADWPGLGTSGTISGTLSGTFSYLAPELLRGETAASASDVFALGSVFYELFTGAHPFAGETPLDVYEAIECRTPEAPSARRVGVSGVVDRVVLGMLERDAEKRPLACDIAESFRALDTPGVI